MLLLGIQVLGRVEKHVFLRADWSAMMGAASATIEAGGRRFNAVPLPTLLADDVMRRYPPPA